MSCTEITRDDYDVTREYEAPQHLLPDHPEQAVWPVSLQVVRHPVLGVVWAALYWDGGVFAAPSIEEIDAHMPSVRELYRLTRSAGPGGVL